MLDIKLNKFSFYETHLRLKHPLSLKISHICTLLSLNFLYIIYLIDFMNKFLPVSHILHVNLKYIIEEEDLQDGGGLRHGDHLPPHKYIKNTRTCGTPPTEHLLNAGRRPQTPQKERNSPTYLGRAKEKRKNRHKRIGTGPAPVGGSCEGGKVSTYQEAPSWAETGGGGGGKLWSHGGECSNRGADGEVERFPHRGSVPTSTHQPERLVCSPAGMGGGWELRLRLRR